MSLILASQLGPEFDALAAAHPAVTKLIAIAPDEAPLERIAAEADALILRPGPVWRGSQPVARPSSWPGRLRWVHSTSVGVDYYPDWIGEAPWFSCGRGVSSHQIADYVVGALYAHARDFAASAVHAREDWKQAPQGSLIGARVAILGLGSIGEALGRRLLALEAQPIGVRRSPKPGSQVPLAASLEEAVEGADAIVIALPATPETRHLVDAKLLARARRGAHVINIARGSILVQEDLLAALDTGQIGFATLDVTEPEPLPAGHRLYTHPHVHLTPHISSSWMSNLDRLHEQLLGNIGRVAEGLPPEHLVDRARGY